MTKYTFTVTNTGTMNLSNVVVTDPKVSVTGTSIATMVPGATNSTNYSATYVITQSDINVGKVINQAKVTANVEIGKVISNLSDSDDSSLIGKNDPTVTPLKQSKQLTLIKGGTLVGTGAVGDIIQYVFTVKNSGNVTVSNIDIDDLMISKTPIVVTPSQLIPGQTGTASATYTITAADFAAGRVVNSAIVIGDAPDGSPVTDISDWDNPALPGPDDPTVVILTRQPSIALIKTADFDDNNNDGRAEQGETVTYRFTVVNTGNTPLSNVTVIDQKPGLRVIGDPISLGIGARDNSSFRAVYVLTAEDIKAGMVENQAKAKGTSSAGVTVEDLSDNSSIFEDNPTVLNFDGCNLTVYNAVTPNEDGINDYFLLEGIECYPDNTVELTNRWGVMVYEARGYDNKTVVFKGTSEGRVTIKVGEQLASGTYYYVIKYKTYLGDVVTKIGYLYISR
jgi:gliding motility-associated-like protein/uncharacterized repeat protein (TIGR01451 family)